MGTVHTKSEIQRTNLGKLNFMYLFNQIFITSFSHQWGSKVANNIFTTILSTQQPTCEVTLAENVQVDQGHQ